MLDYNALRKRAREQDIQEKGSREQMAASRRKTEETAMARWAAQKAQISPLEQLADSITADRQERVRRTASPAVRHHRSLGEMARTAAA